VTALLPDSPFAWIHTIQTIIALAWWGRQCVILAEWRDRHADQARARQHRMPPGTWIKTNAIAGIHPNLMWTIYFAGAIGIAAAAITWPISTYAVAVALLLRGTRNLNLPPDQIAELRQALREAIGIDDRGRPPKVDHSGEHDAGGPVELVIHRHPGWPYWQKAKQTEVERVIEATMLGDWSLVEWRTDGTNVWQRQPELPSRVDYEGPVPDLDWYELPVGPNGIDGLAVADLSEHPHWFIAGSTGGGKTSWLRVAAAHLLHHQIHIVAIDIAYAGLAFLEGRPRVAAAMESFEQIEHTIAALRSELQDRHTELKEHRTYRPPLVIILDELEELCDQARTAGRRTRGAPEPQLILDLLAIGRTGRKVDMHLILATQRPAGDTIPTSLRANCRGRIAFGPMDQHSAQMILGPDWARAVSTANIKGRAVVRCGDWIGPAQSMWLADPDEPKHDDDDRARASALLPARLHPIGHTASAHAPAHGTITVADAQEHPIPTEPASDLAKSRDVAGISGGVGGGGGVSGVVVSEAEVSAREFLDRQRAVKAERQRRYIAKARKEILSNPLDRRHGSPIARQVGCTCPMDRPELHVSKGDRS
jgi:hypothetical protein